VTSLLPRRWQRAAALLLALCLAAAAGARTRTSLNQGWRFAPGEHAGADRAGFDDAAWQAVDLPHTWNAQDAFDKRQPYRRGAGWYRRTLDLSGVEAGQRIFLYFEGANQVADVHFNGRHVGRHVGGYSAFAFDVSAFVRRDAPNLLAVRVDSSHDPDIPPLNADYTFHGGLYRDAWLLVTDTVHLDVLDHAAPGVYIDTPKVSAEAARVRIRATVVNDGAEAREVELHHRVLDPDGDVVGALASRRRIAAGSRASFEVSSDPVRSPRLWSPDDPHLYLVRTEVRVDDRVADALATDFGIRWFEADPQRGFFLNGRPYPLHGSNRHQDSAGKGNALDDDAHRRDVRLVKDTGFNFLRLAHYPQDPAVLDEADRVGLALWEEIPVVNLVTPSLAFADNAERMLVEMIRQHYNHPSVFMWGYMNEVMQFAPDPKPDGYDAWLLALARRLEARARAEDPHRLTATAISLREIDNGSGYQDIAQVLGFNLYFGWYDQTVDALGPFLDDFHARHPDRPLFLSEYGAGSDERIHARAPKAFDFSAEWQQRFHEGSFAQVLARPWLVGSAVWNQFDFGSHGRQDSRFGLNQKGLYRHDRTSKDVGHYYRARLLDKPVLHIAARDHALRAGSRPEDARQALLVYANLDEVALRHDAGPVARKRPDDASVRFDVQLHAGENRFEAIGYRGGEPVARDRFTIRYVDRGPLFGGSDDGVDEIAINAGGSYSVVDATGTVWEAGRSHEAGSWGHADDGGRNVLTHHRIFGTEDDPLWQDTRVGVSEYRFDVPDGEYLLELGFVETEHDRAGQRMFDVEVNGEAVLRRLDLAGEAGRYRPLVRSLPVRAGQGRGVVLRLRPRHGETTLSTVRLKRVAP
jgi:beta-galactosidase